MLTPTLMLLILVVPYLISRLVPRARRSDGRAYAAFGLGLLFLFTASGHFLQAGAMVQMLPAWVPAREAFVFGTGLLEVAIALALFIPPLRMAAAWTAAIVLVAFFPANVYAAFTYAPMGGHAWGPAYLLVRAPLQAFIVWWIWARIVRVRESAARP